MTSVTLSEIVGSVLENKYDPLTNSPPNFIPTRSPLDTLLGGGIAEGSTTVVMGGPGAGKTALLQFIYNQIHKTRQQAIYVANEFTGSTYNALTFAHCDRCEDVAALVSAIKKQLPGKHPVLCIDDATMYVAPKNKDGSRALGGNAQMWAVLMRQWQEDTIVLATQTQRQSLTIARPAPAAGRGVAFAADTMLSVNVFAQIKNGLVLEVEVTKSRRQGSGEKCLLSMVRDVGGRWVEE